MRAEALVSVVLIVLTLVNASGIFVATRWHRRERDERNGVAEKVVVVAEKVQDATVVMATLVQQVMDKSAKLETLFMEVRTLQNAIETSNASTQLKLDTALKNIDDPAALVRRHHADGTTSAEAFWSAQHAE